MILLVIDYIKLANIIIVYFLLFHINIYSLLLILSINKFILVIFVNLFDFYQFFIPNNIFEA